MTNEKHYIAKFLIECGLLSHWKEDIYKLTINYLLLELEYFQNVNSNRHRLVEIKDFTK